MACDQQQRAEAPAGARFDAALDRPRTITKDEVVACRESRATELPRAYPAELRRDAAGGVVAYLPDLPEVGEIRAQDAEAVLAQLPRALLAGLRQVVRAGRALPVPSEAEGRPLVEIPIEVLPRLLLHQRMLAAGLDDAEVERRLGSMPGWSVAALRDPLGSIDGPKSQCSDLHLVMAALWVVQGGSQEEAFGPLPAPEERDDLAWSHRQAALLTLALAGVEAPGLEVASAVDELGSVGETMLRDGEDCLTRGVQLLMEGLAVQAAMGAAGEAAATLLLRRAAEAFHWAGVWLTTPNLPRVSLEKTWEQARWLTVSRLERVGLAGDAVPLRCPVPIEVLLKTFSNSDITPIVALYLLRSD